MFGDRFEDDILGCTAQQIFGFHHVKHNEDLEFNTKYCRFDWNTIYEFFQLYFESLQKLIDCCKRVGERFDWTQGAGGNISIKFEFKQHRFCIVKSSGVALADVSTFYGHSLLLVKKQEYILLWGERPSLETSFHLVCKHPLVVHCHPVSVVAALSSAEIQTIPYPVLPYLEPGVQLAEQLEIYQNEPIILLKNHGLIAQFQDSISSYFVTKTIQTVCNVCSNMSHKIRFDHYDMCNTISLALGGITKMCVYSKQFEQLISHTESIEDICGLALTPDFAVFVDKIHVCETMANLNELSASLSNKPKSGLVIYIKGYLYINSVKLGVCKQIEEILAFQIECLQTFIQSQPLKSIQGLTLKQVQKLQTREDEQYRKTKL
jgi:ribulose-5-phosphate 4-epimerase/fuculose-1-phosphate aldolase